MMSKFYGEGYAVVYWRAEDVKDLPRCKDWSLEKCEAWLQDNENRIQDRLTELGWEVLDSLLMMENDDE
jgi:hypothetical protein